MRRIRERIRTGGILGAGMFQLRGLRRGLNRCRGCRYPGRSNRNRHLSNSNGSSHLYNSSSLRLSNKYRSKFHNKFHNSSNRFSSNSSRGAVSSKTHRGGGRIREDRTVVKRRFTNGSKASIISSKGVAMTGVILTVPGIPIHLMCITTMNGWGITTDRTMDIIGKMHRSRMGGLG